MKTFLSFVISIFAFLGASHAETLKIMSWNIANLAAENGVSVRDNSHKRTDDGFALVSSIIQDANADIIALQEIGSKTAAERVLGDSYEVIMEDRCPGDCTANQGDIFTAIAYRKSLELSDFKIEQLTQLSIPHQSECLNQAPRNVRGGVGFRFSHNGAPYVIVSVHLKASCADERSYDPIGRPNLVDDCSTLDAQMGILAQWMHNMTANGFTVIAAGDYNRKFLENGDRHAAFLRGIDPSIRFEPAEKESSCWPKHYPQSSSYRRGKAFDAFGEVDVGDGKIAFWTPYMPSSIGVRDFFVVSGPNASKLGSGKEILLRPDPIIHDTTNGNLSVDQWKEVEKQASDVGVRFGPPTGYISACTENKVGEKPIPEPFKGSTTVLTFQNIYPSDHCPILIELN